ncbi:MAG TPA: DUF4349 domain-containing protein [Bryobacteraceae bacterium]|nr:DUF4349 domain-containing protein [Bryobacteraceae bacterium]
MPSTNHPVAPEELIAYLDGELPPDQAAITNEHLAQCRECQSIAADLQNVSRRMLAWQVEDSDRALRADLEAALAAPRKLPKSPPTRKGWRWTWMVSLAGACVVLLAVFSATSRRVIVQPLPSPARQAFLTMPQDDGIPASKGRLPRPGEPRTVNGPLIVRTSQLTLTTSELGKTRDAMDALLARMGGHVAQMSLNSPVSSGHSFQATLRVPANQLLAFLSGLRALGHVESESQESEEVTQQVTDLEARLANARATEKRLTEILSRRTDRVSDVLEVEKEIDRVRGEIERMVAERQSFDHRIAFATVNVTISEDYQAGLQVAPPSASRELRNAAVEGWKNLVGSLFVVAQFLLSTGPVLLVWAALLFFPMRALWRRFTLRKAAPRPE